MMLAKPVDNYAWHRRYFLTGKVHDVRFEDFTVNIKRHLKRQKFVLSMVRVVVTLDEIMSLLVIINEGVKLLLVIINEGVKVRY